MPKGGLEPPQGEPHKILNLARLPIPPLSPWDGRRAAALYEEALEPERVWELGCGTGLLLYRLAPKCKGYLGTDFSHEVLKSLREGLAVHAELAHVELEQRYRLQDVTLEDPNYSPGSGILQGFIETPLHFRALREFNVEEGLAAAPEDKLRRIFGSWAGRIHRGARGQGSTGLGRDRQIAGVLVPLRLDLGRGQEVQERRDGLAYAS